MEKEGSTKTGRDRIRSLAEAIARAEPRFDEPQQRVALATYRRLSEGSPAPIADIALASGLRREHVGELLASWPGVYRNRAGDVAGFWGLTIRELIPTHRIEVEGREIFAWCAWDTLFLPELLERTVRVRSICPTTGDRISLVVSPAGVLETSHAGAVVSFLVPDRKFEEDVIQSFCHFVHFFASEDAGNTWVSEHAGTFLLSLQEAFELGRLVNTMNFPTRRGAS
jgi:alkylmercury lyase